MGKYELICIDMFQTLVDIDVRIPYIWSRILRENYSKNISEKCAKLVNLKVVDRFHEYAASNEEFLNLKSIFEPSFFEISKEIGLDFDSKEAVEIFLDEHGNAQIYEDAIQFFEALGNTIPVCLVSDADTEMITRLLDKFNFDTVFISEHVRAYKNEPNSRIFKEVLKHYDIDPGKVIHIGDSSADILGAYKNGIKACWINRQGHKWENDIQPDYIVKSLVEVIDIIS